MHQKAFTLIELLVVIAIIAILAAIVTPGLSNARQRADTAKCMNNLKQIGFAVKSYALEHDNKLVYVPDSSLNHYGEIITNYLPYLENEYTLIKCPAQKQNLSSVYAAQLVIPNSGNKWMTYEFNNALRGKKLLSAFITQPMNCAYAYDFPFDPENDAAYLPHKGGINILYLDWHVAWLPASEYHIKPGEGTAFYQLGHN